MGRACDTGGDMRGGLNTQQLCKSVTPSALGAPASKGSGSGNQDSTVLSQREAAWPCCAWGTGLPAGHVGWDSWIWQTLPTTEPICSTWFPWASPLQLHPVCSSLGLPGWRRTLLQRTDAAHGLFNSGHCRQPLGYPGNEQQESPAAGNLPKPLPGAVSAAANQVSQQEYGSQRRCLGTSP